MMNNLRGSRQQRAADTELFEITPVAVGGDPLDAANKVWLSREQHIQAVRFWNNLILQLRVERASK